MSSKKTIKIDPSLFKFSSGGTRKKDKKPKKERPVINVKPSKIKKELFAKIKEYQKKNEEKNLDYEKGENERESRENTYVNQVLKPNKSNGRNKGIIDEKGHDDVIADENTDDNFDNEFNKSLNFLQELSREKREKMERKKKKKSLKKQRGQVGEVNLDLPSELQYQDALQSSQIEISIPTQGHKNTGNDRNDFLENSDLENDLGEKIGNNCETTPNISKDVPYGCLKQGNKPTFRNWKRETQKKPLFNEIKENSIYSLSRHDNSPPTLDDANRIQDNSERYRERIKRLEQLKQEVREKSNTNSEIGEQTNSINPKPKKKRNKTLTLVGKNTRTTRYKLGKRGRQVSILIKNNETRKNIREDLSSLKRTSILEIKNYLRKHNLIKAGCDAPNDVLRQIFEQAVLSGEITNLNKDNLLHNYFHE